MMDGFLDKPLTLVQPRLCTDGRYYDIDRLMPKNDIAVRMCGIGIA